MKQKILALSVVASLSLIAGSSVAVPSVKANGVGMVNIIPYFNVQGDNATQLSITNTDMVNGKVVKVRFRGAEWSDDIFDFTVFLSPGDVFTGQVTNNGSGVAHFTTADGSCTLPTSLNQDFPTSRLDNAATGTLEGYVEVITMADISPAGTVAPAGTAAAGYSLYTATKHVGGVAPCKTAGSKAEAAVTTLKQDNVVAPLAAPDASTGQNPDWMATPTTGLTSWNRIINVGKIKAFGVPSTAIDFAAVAGKWYFRQANEALTPTDVLTSDRIFFTADPAAISAAPTPTLATTDGAKIIPMYQFDMPDLSTDIEAGASAVTARNNLAAALSKMAVATEFSTLTAVNGAADVVVTQPVRRYFYNYKPYPATTGTKGVDYSRAIGSANFVVQGDAATAYAALSIGNRVGLDNIDASIALPAGATPTPAIFFDREEQFKAQQTDIVISPTPPTPGYSLSLAGEASVVSFNRGSGATETGALGGKLTMNDITIVGGYQTGWAVLSTKARGPALPLPLIGFSAQNVAGANNFGTTLPLRYFGATGGISQ